MAELSGLWRWANLEFQIDGKDGTIKLSEVMESLKRNITLKHLIGVALRRRVAGAKDHSEASSRMSIPKLQSRVTPRRCLAKAA